MLVIDHYVSPVVVVVVVVVEGDEDENGYLDESYW